jgi:hypothetical protein
MSKNVSIDDYPGKDAPTRKEHMVVINTGVNNSDNNARAGIASRHFP